MTKKKENFKKKFQEVASTDYLEKIKKAILKDEAEIKKIDFDLKNILEVNTPLIQFLISVKKFATSRNIDLNIKNMPFSGDKILNLYKIEI